MILISEFGFVISELFYCEMRNVDCGMIFISEFGF